MPELNTLYRHAHQTDKWAGCVLKALGLHCGKRHYPIKRELPIVVRYDRYSVVDLTQPAERLTEGSYSVRVRVRMVGDGWASDYAIRYMTARFENPECPSCNRSLFYLRGRARVLCNFAGLDYCTNCAVPCRGCGQTWLTRNMYGHNGSWYCVPNENRDCRPACGRCGDRESELTYSDYWGESICDDCMVTCLVCGRELENDWDDCSNCVNGSLEYYGHTEPHTWLGGRNADYYLGIELEISADRYNPRTMYVKNWAEHVFGSARHVSCKNDGSVEGYEIVTQPMTHEFFESVDWAEFFRVLANVDSTCEEPDEHGLHVHISRTAFKSDIQLAAFCQLLAGNPDELERISRRKPTGYCRRTDRPVSDVILSRGQREYGKTNRQLARLDKKRHDEADKRYRTGVGLRYLDRGAINLENGATVEIRSGKSTRDWREFETSVRLVYVAAEYVRAIGRGYNPKNLSWPAFMAWVKASEFSYAYDGLKG